ncbi:MAG: tetratricopeptide repeat protein, partial [Leptospiraceae bacterium]|nr:tetratricopeptide repeat protein [Leptospiraceae bacterium]
EMRDDPDVEYNLGVAYLQLNRSEKAVAHLKNATRMRPTFAAAHYNLGVALQQLNRLPEAQGSYTQCVQLNPGYTIAYFNLALVESQQGQLEPAIRHMREFVRLATPAMARQEQDARAHITRWEAELER